MGSILKYYFEQLLLQRVNPVLVCAGDTLLREYLYVMIHYANGKCLDTRDMN